MARDRSASRDTSVGLIVQSDVARRIRATSIHALNTCSGEVLPFSHRDANTRKQLVATCRVGRFA